jgi:hypothetical protein
MKNAEERQNRHSKHLNLHNPPAKKNHRESQHVSHEVPKEEPRSGIDSPREKEAPVYIKHL